ncbi:MAG: hypothetical protein ACI4A7_02610 [Prevotella sp.]
MITVGLDFGTHQTKVCIEHKDGVELNYTFMKFLDIYHRDFYTFPSLIGVGKDGLLSYGYLPRRYDGRIIRYFKQSAFRPSPSSMPQVNAMFFSTWYLAFILFDLEEKYGQEFTIQMGAPTDSAHVNQAKVIATRIIASAYRLVEEVFVNDKEKFLSTPMKELTELTKLVPFSQDVKDQYGLLVFPEAYACLKPLISQGKLAQGMSLMIDIGGGTTDISFFTIEGNKPQVYDFYSINKGLNYLTGANESNQTGTKVNVQDASEIIQGRRVVYINELNQVCDTLRSKLQKEFRLQTGLSMHRLVDALKNRPLVYCGGGSTFKTLRVSYGGYQDKKQISHKEWNMKCIRDMDEIIDEGLCPILSTAYGLAISTEDDNIKIKPFKDIFEGIRGYEEEHHHKITRNTNFGSAYGGFSYADDWDAWK